MEIDEKDGVWIEDCVSLSKFVEDHLNRDKEDFELEVGSAGIGRPFKVLQQYINHLGDEVEVLCTGRQKYKGILKNADEQGIVLTVKQRVKPEGAKRATLVDADIAFTFEELESVCYVINFK